MKKSIYILFLLASCKLWGQSPTITPQVLNSAGDTRQYGSTGLYITDNVGEPFTDMLTTSGVMITQGFIQPEVISVGGFSATVKANNVTCLDKNDGSIEIEITKAVQAVNYQVVYNWLPSNVCSDNTCSSLSGLMAQTYTVNMIITYTNTVGSVKIDSINKVIPIQGSNELCKIKIFNGITANDDGVNDVLIIENIEEFPNCRLMVFNRWGKQLADIKSYNNSTNAWPTKDKLDSLLPSTYFYILDLGDGSKQIKGWLELFKN